MGGLMPLSTPDGDTSPLPNAGLFLMADGNSVLADLFIENGASGAHSVLGLGAGVYVPVGDDTSAAYAGAAIKWSKQQFGGQGTSGFAAQPTVGYLFGRNWVLKLRLELGYFFNFTGETERDRLVPSAGRKYRAHGPAGSLGIGF
jgi:hypothetical protein